MSFSTNMQTTVQSLLEKLGNTCVLTKVSTGTYNPAIGRTVDVNERVSTYSTSMDNASLMLSTGAPINFNLSGFSENKLMIPYIQGYVIDDTWLCNDDEIISVEVIESQNNKIAYIVEVKG